MKLPSVMPASAHFAQVPAPQIQRSKFNRDHGVKTTIYSGVLYPMMIDEVLPGATINLRSTLFARFQTLLAPIMDNVFLDTFFFFVPNRLVWDNWQKFMGEQLDPDSSIDFLIPKLVEEGTAPTFTSESIYDYMGLPTEDEVNSVTSPVSALPLRAYNLIYNTWFRDQNLQDSVSVPKGDGPDEIDLYTLLRRGKRHDYFSSSLDSPQKGPAVTLPFATVAPVIGDGKALGINDDDAFPSYHLMGGNDHLLVGTPMIPAPDMGDSGTPVALPAGNYYLGVTNDPDRSGLIADLASASAITVNDLRSAVAVQQLLELYKRGGTRYIELLKMEFGVTSPDFRLQRPEYLGGGSVPVSVNTVPQTSESTVNNKLGSLGAFGTATAHAGFTYNASEHGYVIGLMNIRADITYQQRIERHWSRRTRYDFFHPVFQNLGEQAVYNREIFFTSSDPDYAGEVWGYQERYAEYRYKPSYVTGKMRSNTPGGSLDSWHLALDFESPVYLDSNWIQDQPPISRVVAVTDEPEFYVDIFHNYTCILPMPVYSIPGLTRF